MTCDLCDDFGWREHEGGAIPCSCALGQKIAERIKSGVTLKPMRKRKVRDYKADAAGNGEDTEVPF